jgi:hypothetical protein
MRTHALLKARITPLEATLGRDSLLFGYNVVPGGSEKLWSIVG